MKTTIQRQRQILNKAPQNLRELIIPREFTITLKNEEFLLFDSCPSNNRILVFSTKFNLNQFKTINNLIINNVFNR